MAVFIRTKHLTSTRLRGDLTATSYSSGSDHSAAFSTSDDPSFFSPLLNYFLNPDHPIPTTPSVEETETPSSTPIPLLSPLPASSNLRRLLSPSNPFRSQLLSDLQFTGPAPRRTVMTWLRQKGYNAGICKSRRDGRGGLTAGSYEYIDVVAAEKRYIVDLGFAGEFEVARATEEYRRVLAAVPEVVVAEPEEVRAAVAIIAEAARRSFKSGGMSVPPWRKKGFMMAKWLGFYRRTVNALEKEERGRELEAGCREVGFGK